MIANKGTEVLTISFGCIYEAARMLTCGGESFELSLVEPKDVCA